MLPDTIAIAPELPEHEPIIEQLNAEAFGPGRFTRAAYRLRENARPESQLCFVALICGAGSPLPGGVAGSVRMTRILVGSAPALLLGPLVVAPSYKGIGIGRELVNRALHAAGRHHDFVILVGDLPYYRGFGFRPVPAGQIALPGPVDPARLLCLELRSGVLDRYRGDTAAARACL